MIFRNFFKSHIQLLILPLMLGICLLPGLAQHQGSQGASVSTGLTGSPGSTGRSGSQNIGEENRHDLLTMIREKYGPDPGLISGIQFYQRYPRVESHPYYDRETFAIGSVSISGRKYEEVLLNYDLYAQQLILEYSGPSRSLGKIILISPHIDEFRLADDHFEKLTLNDEGPRFYQVIRVEKIACYIHWNKEMVPTSNDLSHTYYFSEPKREYLITYDGDLHHFRSRRAFLRIFSGDLKKKIRRYLRQERILLRKASKEQLAGLIDFIGKHIQSGHVN